MKGCRHLRITQHSLCYHSEHDVKTRPKQKTLIPFWWVTFSKKDLGLLFFHATTICGLNSTWRLTRSRWEKEWMKGWREAVKEIGLSQAHSHLQINPRELISGCCRGGLEMVGPPTWLTGLYDKHKVTRCRWGSHQQHLTFDITSLNPVSLTSLCKYYHSISQPSLKTPSSLRVPGNSCIIPTWKQKYKRISICFY